MSRATCRLGIAALLAMAGCATGHGDSSVATVGPCPEGSVQRERVTAQARELWCEKPPHRREGPSATWYRSGGIQSRGEYLAGVREGWWRTWDEQGALRTEVEYHGGHWVARRRTEKDGPARPSAPGDAVHPCPEGTVFASGEPRDQWCERLRADGTYVREGPWVQLSGQEIWESGSYRDGRPDGEFTKFHGRNVPEQTTTWLDGVVVASTSTYPNGAKRSETKRNADGLDIRTSWRADGTLADEVTLRGKERLRRTSWYRNGSKEAEEQWSGAKRNGVQRTYWPNGKLHEEGEEQAGRKVGEWRTWSPEGAPMEVTTFLPNGGQSRESERVRNGDPDGWPRLAKPLPTPPSAAGESPCVSPAVPFSQQTPRFSARGCAVATGPISLELGFSAGELRIRAKGGSLEGPLRVWDSQGRELFEAEFRSGEYDGRITEWQWRADGAASNVATYAAGTPNGPFASWYPNGAPMRCGAYRNGKKDGIWLSCRDTGLCRQREEYDSGARSGTWIEWRDSGEKASESTYRAGKLDGPHTKWTREGGIEEQGQYLDGKKTGRWIAGSTEGGWLDGERDGDWIFRRADGKVDQEGRYERGRRVGEWKRYGPTGEVVAQGSYAWCESPPKVSVARWPDGRAVEEDRPDGCKKGPWSYWSDKGTLYGRFDHDETDARNRPTSEVLHPPAAADPN
jgi:antitoxin component YwqK of YwqJK toxin-antitoxin module